MKGSIVVVFDLDDTLIPEMDFLKSAYLEIAHHLHGGEKLYNRMIHDYIIGANVFHYLSKEFDISIESLLNIYRNHLPEKLQISKEVFNMLSRFKVIGFALGMITDGRSITQRNKLLASGLNECFDLIIISEEFGSEKPSMANYTVFHKYNASSYYYIGDNIKKDFITPNQLGWTSIGLLDTGENIHKQDLSLSNEYLPQYFVKDILEIESIVFENYENLRWF